MTVKPVVNLFCNNNVRRFQEQLKVLTKDYFKLSFFNPFVLDFFNIQIHIIYIYIICIYIIYVYNMYIHYICMVFKMVFILIFDYRHFQEIIYFKLFCKSRYICITHIYTWIYLILNPSKYSCIAVVDIK